jgi:hypothetical protein
MGKYVWWICKEYFRRIFNKFVKKIALKNLIQYMDKETSNDQSDDEEANTSLGSIE